MASSRPPRRQGPAIVKLDRDAPLAVSPRATPYACLANRLYLPMDAILSPPVSDAEFAALVGEEMEAYVWHPAIGLRGFETGEGCPVSRLLEFPAPVLSDWGRAAPGLIVNQRLWSVDPEALPSCAAIMAEARGDI